jgi:hypothetical protein
VVNRTGEKETMVKSRLLAEAEYFEQHRQEFCRKHYGKFAIVKDNRPLGFYDTPHEAYEAGIEAFGLEPFLLKRVSIKDTPLDYLLLNTDVLHGLY